MHTDWQKRYEEGDTAWDKGAPAPGLVDFLEEQPFEGRILVPGCGFGHDAAAIAAASPEHCSVLGLDLAPAAVAGARRRHQLANLSFEQGDFLDDRPTPLLSGPFDALFEHTLFCAISPEWRERYAAAAARVVRSGGLFLAIFYMTPDPGRGPGPPFGVTDEELDTLFMPCFEIEKLWRPARAFEGREGREAMRLMRRNKAPAPSGLSV